MPALRDLLPKANPFALIKEDLAMEEVRKYASSSIEDLAEGV